MAEINRIKNLPDGGKLKTTDQFGFDRVSPDATFKATGQEVANLAKYSDFANDTNRILSHLIAVADIDSKALPNSGKFYDLFDGTNTYSLGLRDTAKSELLLATVIGDTQIVVDDGSDFAEGEEITIQSSSSIERKIISSLKSDAVIDLDNITSDSKTLDVSTQTLVPVAFEWNNNGSSIYVMDGQPSTNGSIYQYNLSVNYDLSTATYATKSFDVRSVLGTSRSSLRFNSDGTKLYVVGGSSVDTIHQFTLSTAYDISTASYDSVSHDFSSQTSNGYAEFNPDGTKLYISSTTDVYQYSLSTAWDVSTISYDSVNFDFSDETTSGDSMRIVNDGYILVVHGSRYLYQYSLSTAYDISTALFLEKTYDTTSTATEDILFNSDDSKLYLLNSSSDNAIQYTIGSANIGFLTVPALENNYSIDDPVYRSLGTIVSDKYVMDDSYDFTTIDIRYNISPISDIDNFATWVTRNKLTGFSNDYAVSIVDDAADESFTSVTPESVEVETDIMEDEIIHAVDTSEDKVTLRITMNRTTTADNAELIKILGAID